MRENEAWRGLERLLRTSLWLKLQLRHLRDQSFKRKIIVFFSNALSLIINYYFSTPLQVPVLAAYYYLLVSSVLTLYHICNIIMIDL